MAIELLECTLRDGSYAIDFKFTYQDTALLCQKLSKIGFKYIEIGHGLGINASEAGKGFSPYSETRLIEVAKESAKNARIGMFSIPGIATFEKIAECAKAGLDFVRVGSNATETEQAFPMIEYARKLGLFVCFNLMKSYALTPEELAVEAQKGANAGAQVIYVVDSSGGMLPSTVAVYVEAISKQVDVAVGFHGHDNLRMSTANSLQAIRSGARYIDCTLYGLGRSAGNTPTEALLAILKKQGIKINIDLFDVLEVGDVYIRPLVKNIESYDMLSVAMGFSDFHSGFLPQVQAVAQKHSVSLYRLVAELGISDPVNCTDEMAERIACTLHKYTRRGSTSGALINVDQKDMPLHGIHQGIDSVERLITSLTAAASKYPRRLLIDLVPSQTKNDTLLSEYLTEDDQAVFGRVVFGSLESLSNILSLLKGRITAVLINQDNCGFITFSEYLAIAREYLSIENLILYSGSKLWENILRDILFSIAVDSRIRSILVFGREAIFEKMIDSVTTLFTNMTWYDPGGKVALPEGNYSRIEHIEDWKDLALDFDIIFCFERPHDYHLTQMLAMLKNEGKFVVLDEKTAHTARKKVKNRGVSVLYFNPVCMYHGHWQRWQTIYRKDND